MIASRRMSRPRGSADRRRLLHRLAAGRSLVGRSLVGRFVGLSLTAATLLTLTGCPDRNRGISPDGAGLFFPAGTVLDPRVPTDEQARWLYVLNANSDLVYNAGTLVPVDIRDFYRKWMRDPEACFAGGDPEACQPGVSSGGFSSRSPTRSSRGWSRSIVRSVTAKLRRAMDKVPSRAATAARGSSGNHHRRKCH